MSRPWFPLYPADYLGDTCHLSMCEHGAYMLLIMHYWQRGGLPDDDARLARIVRATPEQWAVVKPVMAEFFQPGWRHKRIDQELEDAEAAYQRRAKAGGAGGRAKAQKREAWSEQSALPLGGDAASNAVATTPTTTLSQERDPPPPQGGVDGLSLEDRCREAAGLSGSGAPGLKRTGPILALIGEGYSLEGDILPAIRSVHESGHAGNSWGYYVAAIRRRQKPKAKAPGPQIATFWVLEASPEGAAWNEHVRAASLPALVWYANEKYGRGRSMLTRWPPGFEPPGHVAVREVA